MKDYYVLLGNNQLLRGQVCKSGKLGYDIPWHSHFVCETDIIQFLDPSITVLFEKHDGIKANMDSGDYINEGDRDKFGYAFLCGPRDVLTYESVQEANEKFLNEYLGKQSVVVSNET